MARGRQSFYEAGQRVGCYTLIGRRAEKRNKTGYIEWDVQCRCGRMYVKSSNALTKLMSLTKGCMFCDIQEPKTYDNAIHFAPNSCTTSKMSPYRNEHTDQLSEVTCKMCKKLNEKPKENKVWELLK